MHRHFSNRGEALPEITAARMLARRTRATLSTTQSWMPGKRLPPPNERVVAEAAHSKDEGKKQADTGVTL